MSEGAGTTTVTEAASKSAHLLPSRLTLLWRFPFAKAPAGDLLCGGSLRRIAATDLPVVLGMPAISSLSQSGGGAAAGARGASPGEPVQSPALMVALRASGANVARAANLLGISRQRAYRLMEGQAVDPDALRAPAERQR